MTINETAGMSDQVSLMHQIINLRNEGKNDEAMAAACQLNQVASERGFGDNYWLRFCESMVETNKYIEENNIDIDKVLAAYYEQRG